MNSEPSDEELMIAYAGSGESAAAFSELYRRYASRLYGYFLRRLSAELRSLAADLFQKTWLKVHRARDQFDGQQKFAPWLFSIAVNTLRDEWRIPRVVEPFSEPSEMERAQAPDDIEQALSVKQDLARLEIALSKISETQREVLLLSEWEGFSAREIAEVLGISEVAARQTVSRARRKVKQLMEDQN